MVTIIYVLLALAAVLVIALTISAVRDVIRGAPEGDAAEPENAEPGRRERIGSALAEYGRLMAPAVAPGLIFDSAEPRCAVLDWWYPQYEAALNARGTQLRCVLEPHALLQYEEDYLGILARADAVETPTNVFLQYNQMDSGLLVVGITLEAGPRPARLVYRADRAEELVGGLRNPHAPEIVDWLMGRRVAVLGRLMTPTLMLLTYLQGRARWRLLDSTACVIHEAAISAREQSTRIVDVRVTHRVQAQLQAVASGDVDYAWVVMDPMFEQLRANYDLDVVDVVADYEIVERAGPQIPGGVPASVVVIRKEALRAGNFTRIDDVLDALRVKNAAMRDFFSTIDEVDASHEVEQLIASVTGLSDSVVFRDDVRFENPGEEARRLADVSSAFARAGNYHGSNYGELLEKLINWRQAMLGAWREN